MNRIIYGLGIASGLFIKVAGEILSPTLAELGANLHAKVWRKPYIRGQLAEDLRNLESIQNPLLHIHAIPRFPDSYKKTSAWLLEIDTNARKIRTKAFQDIKDKLIAFTSPMSQISINTSLDFVMKTFVKDEKAFKLVEEIREIVDKTIKRKTFKGEKIMSKPTVWYTDDLQSNLDSFTNKHSESFAIKTFLDTSKVLNSLEKEQPDALLCDIFFYDTPEKANEIETKVMEMAKNLQSFAHSIEADLEKNLSGLIIMEKIYEKYKRKPPFPIYAYTSKGPYILSQVAWDRIIKSGAKILLKNRFSTEVERMIISEDIKTYKARRSCRAKLGKFFYDLMTKWGLFSAIAGWIIGYLFGKL